VLRNGDIDGALPANGIDNLAYTYATNTYKLLNVLDNSNNTSGFNDVNKVGDDYTYDLNGNLKTDKNKNITDIVYNHRHNLQPPEFAYQNNIWHNRKYCLYLQRKWYKNRKRSYCVTSKKINHHHPYSNKLFKRFSVQYN
jgi:hypothetical protein